MSKAKKKGATPAPKEPEEQPLESVTVTLTDCQGIKLILKSPEAHATAAACRHLYEHAEKGHKEKLFLLTNDIHDDLIRYSLVHEDKATRYFAVMCLASMARHVEVLPKLAQREDLMPLIVQMCGADEGLTCKTSASFLVASIATINTFYAGVLCKHGAVPFIVALLASTDMDIKRNAIGALSGLCSDVDARDALLSENAVLATIVQYLSMDYREMQKSAIRALTKLSNSPDFREQMRQSNVFDKLLAIFRDQKLDDLHILVLDTMANMMKDRQSFEMMFDNGDAQKVLDDMKAASSKSSKEVLDVVLKFLSALVHQDPTFSSKLFDMGIVGLCQALMTNEEELVVAKTCSLVGALCKHSLLCCEEFTAAIEFFQHLLSHMECEMKLMRDAATYALVFLLRSKNNCRKFMEDTGDGVGVEVLLRSIQETSLLAQKNALNAAMQILSHHDASWDSTLLEKGLVEALLVVLGSGDRGALGGGAGPSMEDLKLENPYRKRLDVLPRDTDPLVRKMLEVRERALQFVPRELMIGAASCLAHFMTFQAGRKRLLEYDGAFNILTRNLARCYGGDRRQERFSMCQAIRHACLDGDVATAFTDAGGLAELYNVLASLPGAVRPSSMATTCITTVLNHNPAMLYWCTGSLQVAHVTHDGFYTMAQLKPVNTSVNQRLPPLEELCKAPRSNAFTAYFVNAVQPEPEKPTSPPPAEQPDTGRETRGGGSRQAKGPKKGRGKLDKDTGPSREEQAAAEKEAEQAAIPAVWSMPPDHELWTMIDEVSQHIMRSSKFPSANLKARELAVYVSNRMGGAFTEAEVRQGKLQHLDHIAELKVRLNTNAVPLGAVHCGTYLHRAMLFKVLADRLFLPCTLHRGNGYTAWNTFQVLDWAHREQIVDLMHKPGALMDMNTVEAQRYMSYH